MRPQKVQDIEIMTSLVEAFRSKGYEGTSLAELAKSTGLKKASLYHRFPNGKQEMANAVLDHIEKWVDDHIFASLLDESKSPKVRLLNALNEVRNSYDGGKEACIFRALSIGQSVELFDLQIKNGMNKWVNAFDKIGLALGLSKKEANQSAVNTLIKIQGSLIVTKGLNDLSIFETTLKEIEDSYLKR
ncbi:TetR/AcrR family transcriptional regulator [Cellulophaga sp. HaHaR_3_176]|uniref:TetR/AcrR family transcriptional regulator n=1 Tax=Cellulophaga sp. HaHaR_3_176 TaxID=1942464 RepID=UPI001C1F826E|nr:TetR/AcrR family transcriptional regulator [Cellulophaga sp. HaHaR_3_176]QWX85180.1 TetR/AcrR family transcriptional regulator [Cellulophaga sp. HaHaR_3_176]